MFVTLPVISGSFPYLQFRISYTHPRYLARMISIRRWKFVPDWQNKFTIKFERVRTNSGIQVLSDRRAFNNTLTGSNLHWHVGKLRSYEAMIPLSIIFLLILQHFAAQSLIRQRRASSSFSYSLWLVAGFYFFFFRYNSRANHQYELYVKTAGLKVIPLK